MTLTYEKLDNGGILYQDDRFHKLGHDSLLLSKFAPIVKNGLICDLGAGQGFLSLFALMREEKSFVHAVEISEGAAEIAQLNIDKNGLSDRFEMHICDMRNFSLKNNKKFDLIICNPPYFTRDSRKGKENKKNSSARSEENITLNELCTCAARLLKFGGYFSLVYPASRLCEFFCSLSSNAIEPKKLCLVAKNAEASPTLALVTAKYGAKPGLEILPPIFTEK